MEISQPTYEWEKKVSSPFEPWVNEGPEGLHHGDKTFVVYSASHCSTDDYTLGLLTAAATADPVGPGFLDQNGDARLHEKTPANQAYGLGHNGFFVSKDGTEGLANFPRQSEFRSGLRRPADAGMQKFTWNSRQHAQFRHAAGGGGDARAGAERGVVGKC